MLSACSWFHAKSPPPREPAVLIVTGVAANSILFIDGVQKGQAAVSNDKPQIVTVSEGPHTVEVRTGDRVVYRESVFVEKSEKRVIKVLSGSGHP